MDFLYQYKSFLKRLLLVGLLSAAAGHAQASSSFDSSALLTFIASGDLAGVDIGASASYSLDNANNSGDWSLLATPDLSYSATAGSFALSGNVNDGELHTTYIADFALTFTNLSTESRSFGLNLAYILNAAAGGEFANSLVQISYGSTGYGEVLAYLFDNQENVTLSATSDLISFNLAQNDTATFNVQVGITGDLTGTTPVPLPAAAWSFLLGIMGMLGFKKRKLKQ